jgi:hypothetical protein
MITVHCYNTRVVKAVSRLREVLIYVKKPSPAIFKI